ncbi:SNARE associated Golgi protein family [Actinidia rufa]|uniref:SNARE associated Golgi protein family n=1 Tax=Actinidia rufa TaxID=165716 RepID=A0A7J0GDL0_9ERIC|nr:SNARE associated Golgi protein family [Actinidia rufa]
MISIVGGLRAKHQQELENLTLTTQPFKTLKFFILAVIKCLKRSVAYLLAHGGWPMVLYAVVVLVGILLFTIDGPHDKHVQELHQYFQFGLWWVALGVASSIGLGSGLHTFVLYLGPHIALFTIKATQLYCLRSRWRLFCGGLGTALGELPPYFISRAASISGGKLDAMKELDANSKEDNGAIATHLNQIKRWFLSHSQYLNFFTILVLASVPNPLFDLAGIMCGQFGIPFWKFFLATMIGKAIIKTHIQTVFIISVCNNQLLDWIENELIWVLSLVPGFASVMPNLVSKLHAMRAKYMAAPAPMPSNIKVKKWDFSFTSIWNTVVWLMIMNFSAKIVTATAQRYLKKEQEFALLHSNESNHLSR